MPRRIVAPGRSTGALSRAQSDDPGRRHRRAHRIRPGPAKPARAGPPRRGSPTPRRRATSATQTGLLTAVAAQGYDLLTDALTAQRPGTSSTSGWPTCASRSSTAPTSRSCSAPTSTTPTTPQWRPRDTAPPTPSTAASAPSPPPAAGPTSPSPAPRPGASSTASPPSGSTTPSPEPRRRPPNRRPQRRRDPVPRPITARPETGVHTATRRRDRQTRSDSARAPPTGSCR